MLSEQERMEMLNDAMSAERRESFRKARLKPNHPTYDAYLKFLSRIQKVFQRAEDHLQRRTPDTDFKL